MKQTIFAPYKEPIKRLYAIEDAIQFLFLAKNELADVGMASEADKIIKMIIQDLDTEHSHIINTQLPDITYKKDL